MDLTVVTEQKVQTLEAEFLKQEQVDCPVVHRFGPGIYIREVFIPAGTLSIGHAQKTTHLNVMLKGRVMMINANGSKTEMVAPTTFVAEPGRKIGYILEDMVWQNIYATDLKNADDVEAYFIEKSEDWRLDHEAKFAAEQTTRAADRIDYLTLIEEAGFNPEVVRQQVENPDDQIWIDSAITRVSESPIEGKGLFVTSPVKAGDVICPARIDGMRTQAGRFTNHSLFPNAKMVAKPNGDIDLVALVDFEGCKGGSIGVEATIDYRQALALSGIELEKQESLCLE